MSTSTNTQKTNVLEYEYDYFTIYSSTSTITLECKHDYFHDYFNEYTVLECSLLGTRCLFLSDRLFFVAYLWFQRSIYEWNGK